MRGILLTVTGITGAICAGVLAAAAFAERVPTGLTLFNPALDGHYYGEVLSDDDKCVKRRKVSVYHDENANGLDGSDFHIGDAKSDGGGEYSVTGNQAPSGDRIIAVVSKKKSGKLTCKKDSYTAIAGAAVP